MRARWHIVTLAILLGTARAFAAPSPADVDVCFVPAESCEARITAAVDAASREILVQAYGFSSHPIIAALLRAKARGVDVRALLDRSNDGANRYGIDAITRAGIPVWIDRVSGIAHVKALLIDRHIVIAGSFNFTAAAQHRNVEDVTFSDSRELAERFRAEWASRQSGASLPMALPSPAAAARLAANETPPKPGGAEPAGMTCPSDRVVWVNTRSGVYHFPGDRYFANTKQGKFACQRDADSEGDRPSQAGR
jgi:phosphatidylserine/phosphatidylglycerophosphate/cardiolipin synthase-like enzyme